MEEVGLCWRKMRPISEPQSRDLAIAELRKPNLALTQQYLSVHRVLEGDSGPWPAGVVHYDDRVDVYFQLVDEDYFLVLSVSNDEEGDGVKSCRAEAKSLVYLAVTSNTMPPEEVTTTLGLMPTTSWRLGDARGSDGRLTHSFHGWFFDPAGDGPGECDQKMKVLLDGLECASSRFGALAAQCSVEIRVVYHGYQSQMWGLHWDADTLRRISALGVEVDVDLYASGPELPD